MRRAGMNGPQIDGVRNAYRLLFRAGLVLPAALARMEKELGHLDSVREMIAFLQTCPRGINHIRDRGSKEAA
jgi:acyl-[acyl carrier protein]--UDP-N-acetylglucosamine O-acyltransferase